MYFPFPHKSRSSKEKWIEDANSCTHTGAPVPRPHCLPMQTHLKCDYKTQESAASYRPKLLCTPDPGGCELICLSNTWSLRVAATPLSGISQPGAVADSLPGMGDTDHQGQVTSLQADWQQPRMGQAKAGARHCIQTSHMGAGGQAPAASPGSLQGGWLSSRAAGVEPGCRCPKWLLTCHTQMPAPPSHSYFFFFLDR